jgi:predicted transcriptional regulator
MSEGNETPTLSALTTQIVAAYVGHNSVAVADIGGLVSAVGRELGSLGIEPEPAKPEPAVPVRRSVRHDHLVCLVCGKPFKSLRRHLRNAHDLTPGSYREMFGLHRDYPMVAAASTERRVEIAKRSGLARIMHQGWRA